MIKRHTAPGLKPPGRRLETWFICAHLVPFIGELLLLHCGPLRGVAGGREGGREGGQTDREREDVNKACSLERVTL